MLGHEIIAKRQLFFLHNNHAFPTSYHFLFCAPTARSAYNCLLFTPYAFRPLPPLDMTFACGTCHKVFYAGRNARDNHCYATGHYAPFAECETCSRTFGSVKAAIQHMDALGHWFGYACDICGDVWDTEDECVQHGIWEHYYCADCQRSFSSYNNAKTVRPFLALLIHDRVPVSGLTLRTTKAPQLSNSSRPADTLPFL